MPRCLLGAVVSADTATPGPQLGSAAPGPDPGSALEAAGVAWGLVGARWGRARPAGPVRMARGWVADALTGGEGRDLVFFGAASCAAPPEPGGSGRPKGRDGRAPVCNVGTRVVSALMCKGILLSTWWDTKWTQHAMLRVEVPVGLVLCVLDLCLSLSAEIKTMMCCGAFLKAVGQL